MQENYHKAHFFGPEPAGGFPESFAIITAFNPGSIVSPDLNLALDKVLRERLKVLGLPHFPVEGGDLDGSHREPGWGIVIPELDAALDLAREFRQDAIFWVEAWDVYLIFCDGSIPRQSIGWWEDLWRPNESDDLSPER